MIRITFSREQGALAERVRDDLDGAAIPAQPTLLVILSARAAGDAAVLGEIDLARRKGERIVPILAETVALPTSLAGVSALDFRAGYDRAALLERLAEGEETARELRGANRRALAVIGALAAFMFGLAILAMARGYVAFPVAEYNEEATFQAQWIGGLIGETLEYVAPAAGVDGQSYGATYEAAPTRLHFYIRGTATAAARPGDG